MVPLAVLDGNLFSVSGAVTLGAFAAGTTQIAAFIPVCADCTGANTEVAQTSVDGSKTWKLL